jgi:hypothetical protein
LANCSRIVALALVAEDDRPLEQCVLQFLRPVAPQVGGGAENHEVTIGVLVSVAAEVIRCIVHG